MIPMAVCVEKIEFLMEVPVPLFDHHLLLLVEMEMGQMVMGQTGAMEPIVSAETIFLLCFNIHLPLDLVDLCMGHLLYYHVL